MRTVRGNHRILHNLASDRASQVLRQPLALALEPLALRGADLGHSGFEPSQKAGQLVIVERLRLYSPPLLLPSRQRLLRPSLPHVRPANRKWS